MWILFLVITCFTFYLTDGFKDYMQNIDSDWANMYVTDTKKPQCVDIPANLTLCRDIGYNQMALPNLLGHETINEVIRNAKTWNALVGIRCHPDTRLFLCSVFSPVCVEERTIWPCQSLCKNVQAACEPAMLWYGFPWPKMLNCDKIPRDSNATLCIEPQHNVTISKYIVMK